MAQNKKAAEPEIFHPVPSLSGLKSSSRLLKIIDDRCTLTLEFADDEKTYSVAVANAILYKRVEERFALATIQVMADANALGEFALSIWNSPLLSWIRTDGLGSADDLELHHIRLCFAQDIVDILVAGPVTEALPNHL